MKHFITVAFCCSAGIASIAHAHGDAHADRKVFDEANAEQTQFGKAGDPKKSTRVIRIAMDDKMRFTPNAITVRQGETVKFIVTNKGKILHEMVIGTRQELQDHAAMMKKFPGMEHDEPHMAHVRPGKSESLVWTFNKPGDFEFACLIAGHFEAGMVGKIKVIGQEDVAPKINQHSVSSSSNQPAGSVEGAKANIEMTEGEVNTVDKQAGKIVIRHGPIANLAMPGMTMAFRVKEAAILDQVKPGDKIRFEVGKIKGAYTVLRVEPAR